MAEIENLQIVGGAIYTVGNQDIIADDWEAGKAYIKDRSYAIKDHKLYQCAVSHTSVEPFDPTKWTEKTVAEALGTAGSANMIECTLAEYTAWKAGGQLINETVYVITDAPNLNATAQEISYDGGADTVWDKVEEIKPTFDIGGTAKGVSGTYQIPAGVLAHSIITIGLRRYAYGGEVTLVKENITAGAYTNGLVIYGSHDKYVEFTVSTTGLITITAIQNWADVFIDLIGTF